MNNEFEMADDAPCVVNRNGSTTFELCMDDGGRVEVHSWYDPDYKSGKVLGGYIWSVYAEDKHLLPDTDYIEDAVLFFRNQYGLKGSEAVEV